MESQNKHNETEVTIGIPATKKVTQGESTVSMKGEDIMVRTEPIQQKNSHKLLRLAVIGTGNCGGQLANEASKEVGIDAIALNGSQQDLDLLDSPKINRFQIGDGKGTGKDRNVGKQFLLSNINVINEDAFVKVIMDNDVILITTSTGGGYGSGTSTELVDLLSRIYPDKIFILVGVIPFIDEGYAAFKGTKQWLKELQKLEIGYILYDNNRYTNIPPNKAIEMVNANFVKDLKVIQGDYLTATRTGGIDARDMLTVLSVPGRLMMDVWEGLEEVDIIDGSIIKTMKQHMMESSSHAELVEDKEIKASALIYTLGETFDSYKSRLRADLQDVFGEHIKDTSNFADSEDQPNSVAWVLAGLTEPTVMIDRIINRCKSVEDTIRNRKSATSKLSIDSSSDDDSLDVVAKKSFSEESKIANNGNSKNNADEMIRRFLEERNK